MGDPLRHGNVLPMTRNAVAVTSGGREMLDRRAARPADTAKADLEPQVAAFVEFLGQLFAALDTTLTRLSARCHRNKGSVSRYFSGERIAPKSFVEDLLRQVVEHTGQAVTAEVRDQAHLLRMDALRVRNPARYQLDELADRLGAAERELRLATVRERALLEAYESKAEQARQAEQRYLQLESDWATAQYTAGAATLELYTGPDQADEIRDELLALKSELEALRLELARAQALKHAAEEHCVRLEARLLAAEATLNAERSRARTAPPPAPALESSHMTFVRQASSRIGSTPDLDTTARELCQALTPLYGDFACVDLLDGLISDAELPDTPPDDRTELRRLARAFNPATAQWDHVLDEGTLLTMLASTPPGLALQENKRVLVPVIGPDAAAGCAVVLGGPELAAVVAGSSVVVVPLSVRGRVLGVLTVLRLPDRAPFTRSDADTLQELAVRAALSLDNA
ncbi:GAF domain-containing protein, partial [Kitasatospora sp. NPDC048365]|uniref:GAF domain-containing protein n=1 Tax=Kitasatospora sp. NPDC048365 TaxID=3364050 RepID=UPI003719DB89